MMEEEYIIISKTVIQKRIEELEKQCENPNCQWHDRKAKSLEINSLQEILSQSTPLVPEIEKALDEGKFMYLQSHYIHASTTFEQEKQGYISNLKLDI